MAITDHEQPELIPYQVFISYAKEDTKQAIAFYDDLTAQGIRAWIDVHQLNPGENWELGIKTAIRKCPYIIVLLSSRSVSKHGYVQKEIREALDIAETIPDNEIFILPVRLESCLDYCDVPIRLQKLQWCDAFQDNEKVRLFNFLKNRLGISRFPLLREQERELRLTLSTDIIADSILLRKFMSSNRVLRSKTIKTPLYISNGYCIDIRKRNSHFMQLFDETFPECEKRESSSFQSVIITANNYRNKLKVVHSIDILENNHNIVALKSKDNTRVGIDRDYWNYISIKYRNGIIYLTGESKPIIIEDDGEVCFVVMAMVLSH